MSSFVQRSSSNFNEPLIVLETLTSAAFRNIRSNAIRRSNKLCSYRTPRKWFPVPNNLPYLIGKILGYPVDFKFMELKRRHHNHPFTMDH